MLVWRTLLRNMKTGTYRKCRTAFHRFTFRLQTSWAFSFFFFLVFKYLWLHLAEYLISNSLVKWWLLKMPLVMDQCWHKILHLSPTTSFFRCFAALGNVSKARFLNKTNKIADCISKEYVRTQTTVLSLLMKKFFFFFFLQNAAFKMLY